MSVRPWLATMCLIFVACGNSRSNNDAGVPTDAPASEFGTGRTIRSACEEQAASRCLNFEMCGSLEERVRYASEAACRTESVEDCVRLASLPDLDRPISFVDRCTSSIELAPCGSDARLKGCDGIGDAIGPRPAAAPCTLNAQCFDGACNGYGCGTCYRRSRVGDPCSGPTSCRPDLGCDPTGHCAPRPTKVGDPCAMLWPCPTTLYCKDGVCAQGALPIGSTCDFGWTMGCAEGLDCELAKCSTPGSPARTYEFVQLGESCISKTPDVQLLCRGAARCDGKTCVPPVADGESCMAGSNVCESLSYCPRETEKCTPIEQCLR